LKIRENESASSFIKRFTYAKTTAEAAANVYSDDELVDFVLARLRSSKQTVYQTALQLYRLVRLHDKKFTLREIEQNFFQLDEGIGRDKRQLRTEHAMAAGSTAVIPEVVDSTIVVGGEVVIIMAVVRSLPPLMQHNNNPLLPATSVARRGILLVAAPPILFAPVAPVPQGPLQLLVLASARVLHHQLEATQPLPMRGNLALAAILVPLALEVVVAHHVLQWYVWRALYSLSMP
jgi:hypothetical protein